MSSILGGTRSHQTRNNVNSDYGTAILVFEQFVQGTQVIANPRQLALH